jgi:cytochrome b561
MASESISQRRDGEGAPPEGRSLDPDATAAPYEGGLNDGDVVKPVPPPGRSADIEDIEAIEATAPEEVRYEGPVEGYVPAQRRLHWIVAGLVVLQLLIGIWIGGTLAEPDNQALLTRLFAVHGGTGALIFVLMLVRLQYRRSLGAPPPPPGTPEDVALLARVNHLGFYVLLLILPVIGWLSLSAAGFSLSLFGIVSLPSPLATDQETALVLGRIHGGLALVLFAGIIAHLGGVYYHTYIRRDGLLRRMSL